MKRLPKSHSCKKSKIAKIEDVIGDTEKEDFGDIVYRNGRWFVDRGDLGYGIRYCPFCGCDLEKKRPREKSL